LAGKTLDKTQFGSIAEILGYKLIPAGSTQAKGRIERLWETLQSRLPVWFALNSIITMEQANATLQRFIREFNRRFRREPSCHDDTAFAPLPADFDLDTLFASTAAKRITAAASLLRITPSKLTAQNRWSKKYRVSVQRKNRFQGVLR
jgi:hypothetical protein